ncbi:MULTISPECIES: hypothetical protein [unclassified Luteimonas]
MQSMIELHPKPDALHGLGLPAIPYPVALPAFQAAVANDGELPLADMLHGLQLRAAAPAADWQRMAPAMARLAELLAPEGTPGIVTAGGGTWLEIGPIDLGADVVTLQRGELLLAAITPRDDGRLRLAAYRPLDGHALRMLLALPRPSTSPGSADQRGHWERAQDAAAGDGPRQAGNEGLSYLAHWTRGLGIADDGRELPEWRSQTELPARESGCVAAEIDTFLALSGGTA